MKRKFLLISMCAAVMFFSSCSKEDNGSVDTKEVNNQTEVNATKAITVSAKQKSSVSKVALGIENQGKYEEVFSEGEVLKLYLNGEEITTLTLTDGAGKTSATFSGEIPLSADGKSISAKILPKDTPSGLTVCSSFADAVSNYASLSGIFDYSANAANFSLDLDDEVSYFVVETNKFSSVDINGNDYTVSNNSVVFAFNENQTVSSIKLDLSNQVLTAGGNVYFKTLNVVTGISLNKTSTTIVDVSETLTATISPANATNNSVTWTSSDTEVATVDENGEVTAVANGIAIITATANDGSGVYRECYVRVESEAIATSIRNLSEIWGSGKYILSENIEVDNFSTDPNSNIDIDLNGHTITVSDGIMVQNATLTLRGSGTIIVSDGVGVSINENSVLNLYDNVTINTMMTSVDVHNNAVLNICDNVTISRVVAPAGKVNMYGGSIENIYVNEDNAVFNYQGGEIENGL